MAKIKKLKTKGTGEIMYPLTVLQAVVDPETDENVKDILDSLKNSGSVDSELSDTSENPVQNKVIKAALDSLTAMETLILRVEGARSFTITIQDSGGNTIGSQVTTSGTYKIGAGVTYSIYPSAVTNYNVKSSYGEFVAVAGNTRVVDVNYEIKTGVYIRDTEGYFHTTSSWTGTYTADCVAVITPAHRFGVGLTWKDSSYMSNSGNIKNYAVMVHDEEDAMHDLDGVSNTARMVKGFSSTSYPAGWCNNYTFPDGKKGGYMPAIGELVLIGLNRTTINEALTKVGSYTITDSYYWSSTYYQQQLSSGGYWWICIYDSDPGNETAESIGLGRHSAEGAVNRTIVLKTI